MNTSKLIVIAVASVVGLIIFGLFATGAFDPPPYIKKCVSSHTEQRYQPPMYVAISDGISVPVGGGMRDVTVCDEYQQVPNPAYHR